MILIQPRTSLGKSGVSWLSSWRNGGLVLGLHERGLLARRRGCKLGELALHLRGAGLNLVKKR